MKTARHLASIFLLCLLSFGSICQEDSTDRASAFENAIHQARINGEIEKAEDQAALFTAHARKSNNEVWLARAFFEGAKNDIARNDYREAQSKLIDAIVIFDRNNEQERLGRTYLEMSTTYFHLTEFVKSLEFDNKALELFQQLGDPYLLSNTYNNMGTTFQNIGELEEAINIYERSLDIVRELNDEQGIATVLHNISTIQSELGNYENSLRYSQDVLEIDSNYNDVPNMAFSHMTIASTLASMNELTRARENIVRAIDLFDQAQAAESVDRARIVQAEIEIKSGNISEAEIIADGVIARAKGVYPELMLKAYKSGARSSIEQSNYVKAEDYSLKALALSQEAKRKPVEIEVYELLVEVYKSTGEYKKALDAIEKQKQLEDEVKDIAGARAAARMQVRSELVRRESRIKLLENEKALNDAMTERKQNKLLITTVAVGAGLIFLLLLVGRMMQSKTNKNLSKLVDKKTQELQVKNVELSNALRTIELESTTDPLTGLHNRRYINKSISSDLTFSRRGYESWFKKYDVLPNNSDLIVFMIDIDNFKLLNDTYGHQTGDIVLVEFAKRIAEVFRLSDYLVRWGGEEFLAIARFVNRDGAPNLADRLLERINSEPFYINHEITKRLTCSVGYSCYPVSHEVDMKTSWEKLVSLADAGLYLAKHSGKNTWFGVHSLKRSAYLSAEFTKEDLQEMVHSGKVELRTPNSE